MARRRRRNPAGVVEWMKAHPWMTFFLASSALSVPLELYRISKMNEPPPAPPHPLDPLSLPTVLVPSTAPQELGGGVVFVPGVVDG